MLLHRQRRPFLLEQETVSLYDFAQDQLYRDTLRDAFPQDDVLRTVIDTPLTLGARLIVPDVQQLQHLALLKTVETYHSPENGGPLYLERVACLTDRRTWIPYKVRYRTTTQVLKNLLILPGVTAVQQAFTVHSAGSATALIPTRRTVPAESRAVAPMEVLLANLAEYLSPDSPLQQNVYDALRSMWHRPSPNLFDFAEEQYTLERVRERLRDTLVNLLPEFNLHLITPPTPAVMAAGPQADRRFDAFLTTAWKAMPAVLDTLTHRFLSRGGRPLSLRDLSHELRGERLDSYRFEGQTHGPLGEHLQQAGAILNDPQWFPFLDAILAAPLTDFEILLHLNLDALEEIPTQVDLAIDRFAPERPMTEVARELAANLASQIRAEPPALLAEQQVTFGSYIELSLVRTFDEMLYLSLIDPSTGEIVRQDIIDLAITPLLSYGIARPIHEA